MGPIYLLLSQVALCVEASGPIYLWGHPGIIGVLIRESHPPDGASSGVLKISAFHVRHISEDSLVVSNRSLHQLAGARKGISWKVLESEEAGGKAQDWEAIYRRSSGSLSNSRCLLRQGCQLDLPCGSSALVRAQDRASFSWVILSRCCSTGSGPG